MKLYYSPGACSLSPHIALKEAGLPFDLVRVDVRAKKLEDGSDFLAVNPKGQVPALVSDDGDLLTEGAVIVQKIADSPPQKNLAPAQGSSERYKLQEWLTFISSELHKTFSPWLFHPEYGVQAADVARERLRERFQVLEAHLAKQDYLVGGRFSVADAYCFTIMNWSRGRGIDLSPWPHLAPYLSRIGERPGVHAALVAEGLRK